MCFRCGNLLDEDVVLTDEDPWHPDD